MKRNYRLVIAAVVAALFGFAALQAQAQGKRPAPQAPSVIGSWTGKTYAQSPTRVLGGTFSSLLVTNQWPTGVFGGSMYSHNAKGVIDAQITYDTNITTFAGSHYNSSLSLWHVQISFGSGGVTWRLDGVYSWPSFSKEELLKGIAPAPRMQGDYEVIDNKTHKVLETGTFLLSKQ